jgi:multiple sugar transport system permease protein
MALVKQRVHEMRSTAIRSKKSSWGFIKTVVLVGVILYGVILIAPLFLSFYYSLTNLNPLYPDTKYVGLRNFKDIYDDARFVRALTTTFTISLVVTVAANVGGLGIAMLLNRNHPFYNLLRTIFFVPQVLSGVIVSFIWIIILTTDDGIFNILLNQLGLINENIAWLGEPKLALRSLMLVITWQQLGFCTVIYLAALKGVPQDLMDAAKVDGANAWNSFRHVTFPLLGPGITTNIVLLMIITLKLYDQVAVLTAGGPARATETLSYYIIRISFTSNEAGYGSALALVLFVIIAVSSIILTTYLRRREIEF